MWQFLLTLFYILLEGAAILSACHALFTTRTSQGTIAWVIALVAFPLVAVPFYWFFGFRRYDKYALSMQRAVDRHQLELKAVYTVFDHYKPAADDPRLIETVRDAQGIAQTPFVRGNRVQLLIDGTATFAAILGAIRTAEHSIFIQFYIVHDDQIGRELAEALMERASAGIHVHFLYDGWGSKDLPEPYITKLRDAGVKAEVFDRPRDLRDRWQLNFRNHRKIVVVDEHVAFVGGHNVGDEYLGRDPRFGHWRDTHLQIEGPAVLAVALVFAGDWHFATGKVVPFRLKAIREHEGGYPVMTLGTGASDRMERCTLFFLHLITMAKHRLWIASPYFVPDEGILNALQLAAMRGVDVRILLPLKPDHRLVWLASFTYLEELDDTPIQIFRYKEGFLHQKVVLVDNDLAAIGTANFDNRSFRLNFEVTVATADPTFAKQVEAMLEADFANAQLAEANEYHSKPLPFRIGAKAARLLGPIL